MTRVQETPYSVTGGFRLAGRATLASRCTADFQIFLRGKSTSWSTRRGVLESFAGLSATDTQLGRGRLLVEKIDVAARTFKFQP